MDIGWRASAEINLAGSVASKLLAAVGAGGVALSVWALRFAQRPGRAGVRALEFVGERLELLERPAVVVSRHARRILALTGGWSRSAMVPVRRP